MKNYPDAYSSATIHEYRMVSASLAKVTCSIREGAKREEIAHSINQALKGAGAAVLGSFRLVDKSTAVGFVAASREVRPVESPAQIAAGYRILSANMYLDNADKSLWELKEGASGKYLARNGVDNLESLIQASRVSPTGSVPRLNRIVSAAVAKHEFVAFVKQSPWSTDTDYGFCVASNGDMLTVVTEEGKETVHAEAVVASYVMEDAPKRRHLNSSVYNEPINNMKDYYKLAYGGPNATPGDAAQQAYVAAIMDQIDEMGLV